MNSSHFMVVAFDGAGTSDVLSGADVLVRDVVVGGEVDVDVAPPGSVVIATDPSVVRTQAASPRHMTAVATTRTGTPIPQP
ncbi:hypothetical protein [Mycobacterium sp.]|uniref:hypothetical protein n=1 Tax=Mycobacterium sp. TaxID=1785 RepID=UPI003C74E75B